MKTVEVVCVNCGASFQRRLAEVKRNSKRGRQIFCSLSCSAKYVAEKYGSNLKDYLGQKHPNFYRKKSPLSDFNRHYHSMLGRCKKFDIECSVTKQDLLEKWQEQKGICPYTGWGLTHTIDGKPKLPISASLDRIDSKKGYTRDNIEFVALIVQYAKNDWDGSVIKEFAKAVFNKG